MENLKFVSVAQAAKYAGVSQQTVLNWRHAGKVAGHRVGPQRFRIDRASLRRYVTSQNADGLLTPMQAAEALGLERHNIYRRIADGRLAAVRINSRKIGIRPEEITRLRAVEQVA